MKIAIITSNHLRHKFFAKKIAKIVDVDVCIFESKPLNTQSLKDSELKYFGDLKNYKFDSNQILIQKGEINSDKIHNDLIKYHIDYIFTFGCSLLLPRIFEIPSKKCINIHTGLVQHYRGVDSSMWAAWDNRFDLIGSTIHEIDSSIDGGKVLFQKKINFSDFNQIDSIDDLFIKNCINGINLLCSQLHNIFEMKFENFDFKPQGKLYQNKDRNDAVIKQAEKNLLTFKSKIGN